MTQTKDYTDLLGEGLETLWDEAIFQPTPNGNTLQCPHCHRDTGYPLITGEVLFADKRCPFCGKVVVYANNIIC